MDVKTIYNVRIIMLFSLYLNNFYLEMLFILDCYALTNIFFMNKRKINRCHLIYEKTNFEYIKFYQYCSELTTYNWNPYNIKFKTFCENRTNINYNVE